MKFLVILTTLYSISSAFEITKAEPKVVKVKEDEPRDVILSCHTNDWWNTCDFSHNGRSVCKIKWTGGKNVKVDDSCEKGLEYVGQYSQHICALKIRNVGFEQDGKWLCKMEDYDYRNSETKIYDTESMKITIIPLPTTTTTTTTTIKNRIEDLNPRIDPGNNQNNTATSIKLGVAFSFFFPMFFL